MISERLRIDEKALGESATSRQRANVRERVNALHRKFKAWDEVHLLYMPAAAVLRARDNRRTSELTVEIPVYDTPLYLPSSLLSITLCDPVLQRAEFRLREAQVYDALEELRQRLRLQAHMYKYKDKNVVGQRASTRQQGLIGRVDTKVQISARKYRTARKALCTLSNRVGETKWKARLLPLEDDHIRRLSDDGFETGQGKRTLSWIWTVVGVGADSEDAGMQEGAWLTACNIHLLIVLNL